MLDAEVLLSHVLRVPRARLKSHPEMPVSTQAREQYLALIARRAAGVPLAYLTGVREFWSLTLQVSEAVLVPRPETELLVERALTLGPQGPAWVADLGTGSGAIALALARERPQWKLIATDISPAALQVARDNAARLNIGNVEFRAGDWFGVLGVRELQLLVSNPPYVAADDPALGALAHEPILALTAGPDGMDSLRALARGAREHLAPQGWLLLEHGAGQGAAVRAELVRAGLRSVRSRRDLAGHERMTEGQR
ncbi:MAG: peptide chain release factor N(5)-glutamine methyltransferase [Proteobacteria bacterium]|nr:peptide chain release factor N(5)-glutamine methyltransferase [Pseudomonadota bacterium]